MLSIGVGFKYLAKFIANKAHIRKLTNDLNYTKSYIREDPDVQEFCMENNQKYNEYYHSRIGLGKIKNTSYDCRVFNIICQEQIPWAELRLF